MNEDVMLAKWLNGEMTPDELRAFELLPEYTTYSRIKHYSAQLTVPDTNIDNLYQKIQARKNRPQPKVLQLTTWMPRIAAVLVIALGLGFYFYTTKLTTEMASMGARTAFLLPDNSQVTLNSGSVAEYKAYNWSNNRRLELNGEAYFKAAKGKTFDVVTPLGTITVVGTQFNVRARGNRLDVTCYEGRVRVSTGTASVLLTPGKTVAYIDGKNLLLPDDTAQKPGWLTYETNFSKESLTNVVAEMERQYNTPVTIASAVPAKLFTGPVPMNDMDTALDVIETVYHLHHKKDGNKIILTAE